MTAVSYALGTPRPAASRGGDCTVWDLTDNREVGGPHMFVTTTACQIRNGMLRLTCGASGVAPSLTVEAWRGRRIIGDALSNTLSDTLPGSISTPAWLTVGTLTIDSPSVTALLTAIWVESISAEVITMRLVAPLMGDAYVSLHRGERQVHVQHGSDDASAIDRRIRLTASPSPVGTAYAERVEEMVPAFDGFPRYVGSLDAATESAAAFSLTASSVSLARFGAGVGTTGEWDHPSALHSQLGDASLLPQIVVT